MRHFEFWPPRIFEAPYLTYLTLGCVRRRLPLKFLAKANYALDHGEIGFGSKLHTQRAFDPGWFLPTQQLSGTPEAQRHQARSFASDQGYPLILKPDRGRIGKGIVKVDNAASLESMLDRIEPLARHDGPYLIQKFTPKNVEFGIFYVRQRGRPKITGLNRKHFPVVEGDGRRSLGTLAHSHPRYRPVWRAFLAGQALDRVPAPGERVQLSFIGSHTLGCMFSNDTHKLTTALQNRVFEICASQPGFNFGRLDVKAESERALLAGEFVVIEVNGIASLPTHMFDPRHTPRQGYEIFFEHARYLLDCADENRHQPMVLDSWPRILRRLRDSQRALDDVHDRISADPANA